MPRKKKPETLEELYVEKEKAQEELRKAKQKEKILNHQLSKLTRNARTHRLCTRGAMLETFLPHPELLEDDEIMSLLKVVFHTNQAERSVEKLAAESEARGALTE